MPYISSYHKHLVSSGKSLTYKQWLTVSCLILYKHLIKEHVINDSDSTGLYMPF